MWPFKRKLFEQYFHIVLFIILYKVVLTFKSVDETLLCDHSIQSYWAVLSCGTVCNIQLQDTEQYFHCTLFLITYLSILASLTLAVKADTWKINWIMTCHSNTTIWVYWVCLYWGKKTYLLGTLKVSQIVHKNQQVLVASHSYTNLQ